jgi:hypothetical protein
MQEPEAQRPTKPKSKKPIANARVGILDKETGEVIDEGDLIYVPKKIRIKGGGFKYELQHGLTRRETPRGAS